jgi:hypothetical protein
MPNLKLVWLFVLSLDLNFFLLCTIKLIFVAHYKTEVYSVFVKS